MTRLTLGLALLLPGVGCLHVQPVGPLAKEFASTPPSNPAPGAKATTAAKDGPPAPVVQPAPPPPPPALLVSPAEVTEANYPEKVRRLMDEMEADRKAMESMPRPAEISVVKGGGRE